METKRSGNRIAFILEAGQIITLGEEIAVVYSGRLVYISLAGSAVDVIRKFDIGVLFVGDVEITFAGGGVLILDIDGDRLSRGIEVFDQGSFDAVGHVSVVILRIVSRNGKGSEIDYIGNSDDVADFAGLNAVNVGDDLCLTVWIGLCQLRRRYRDCRYRRRLQRLHGILQRDRKRLITV